MVTRVHLSTVVLLVILCSILVPGSKSKPHCYYTKAHGLYTVNCSEQDFSEVPNYLKNSTEVLDLSDNKIKHLSNNSFIYYTSIQILYLSDNRILHIEEGAFVPLTELKTLDLSSNALTRIPSSLPDSLVKLYLAGNPIEEVNLSKARSLQFLSLADTYLEKLPPLGILPSLLHLNISHNKILLELPPEYLAPLCRIQVLHLPTPLLHTEEKKCDCHRLKAWILSHHITVEQFNCPYELENNTNCDTKPSATALEQYKACQDEWDRRNMPYWAFVTGFALIFIAIGAALFLFWRRRRSQPKQTLDKSAEPEKAGIPLTS